MILNAIRQLTADLLPVHKTLRGAEVWMRVSTYVLNPLLTHTTQLKQYGFVLNKQEFCDDP